MCCPKHALGCEIVTDIARIAAERHSPTKFRAGGGESGVANFERTRTRFQTGMLFWLHVTGSNTLSDHAYGVVVL